MNYLLGALATLFFFLLVIYYLKVKIKDYRISKKIRNQLKRGIKKEEEGRKVLIEQGYKIISKNQKHSYYIQQDNSKIKITIETDYIVYKNKRKLIVEVKTGIDSPKITNRNTRRQILEYYSFIENDGILLLNMETKKISEINFPTNIIAKHSSKLITWAITELIIIGLLIYYIISL